MDCDKIIAGSLFTGLSLALTPIYVKIIHILLWNTEFRRLRCYQIMVQIGIIDCMFVLGYAVFGVSLPLENDFYGFPFVVVQLLEGVWMTKVSLNVALAINRLTVTCRLTIPAWLHWIKMLYCWLLGLFYFIICLTPYTGLRLDFDSFGWTYNMSKPYTAFMQKVDVCYATGALAFCFLMYLIAALILLLSRMKYSVNNGNHKMELRICVMAVVLFSSPMLGDLLWNFAFEFLPKSHWTNVAIGVFSICNIALAAPTVYLVMNKSLRRIFFNSGLFGYKNHTLSAVNPMHVSVVSISRAPSFRSARPYSTKLRYAP